MLKLFRLVFSSFLFSLLFTQMAFAQPNNVQLEYEVSRNGKAFGTVKESYIQTGNQYRIISTTKGTGVYALLGERVLTSEGAVTAEGLKPTKFHLKRGDNARKSLTADFDWTGNVLNMLVKGKTKTAKLVAGTQDLASYAYQLMLMPPKGEQMKLPLTTGKKLKHYVYNIKKGEPVKVAGSSYPTVHLVNAEVNGKKKKELWLAKVKSGHTIPIKYLVIDKHGDKLEQILTKVSIQ